MKKTIYKRRFHKLILTSALSALAFMVTTAMPTHAQTDKQASKQTQNAPALEKADQEALDKTKELMLDPKKRQEAIKKDPNAIKADDFAKSVGGKNTDEIYALATKVFEKLVIKYNGDTNKIQEVLDRAAKDPAGFASSEFTAEELSALRELTGKLPVPAAAGK